MMWQTVGTIGQMIGVAMVSYSSYGLTLKYLGVECPCGCCGKNHGPLSKVRHALFVKKRNEGADKVVSIGAWKEGR